MILTTLEQEEYDKLIEIQKKFPHLTFMHEPYQEWIPTHFIDSDKEALQQIKELFRKAIYGFRNFTNFFYNKKDVLCVRFYYDWSFTWNNDTDKIVIRDGQPFIGVGYLKASELLNGFEKHE